MKGGRPKFTRDMLAQQHPSLCIRVRKTFHFGKKKPHSMQSLERCFIESLAGQFALFYCQTPHHREMT